MYTSLLRLSEQPVVSALVALFLAEGFLVLTCAAIKKLLVGSKWGSANSTPFWSWRHFSYFFAQDCFLCLVQADHLEFCRDRVVKCDSAVDGVQDRQTDPDCFAHAGFRLERREIW